MKRLLAIDPGTEQSAWLLFDPITTLPIRMGIDDNHLLIELFVGCAECKGSTILPVIEMVASYGMPVGREVFETCVWIGRFHQAMGHAEYVYRNAIKLYLCHSPRAKDANIRQALIDRYDRCGGGSVPQVGTKSKPGPLYGFKSHLWSALAIAIYYSETHVERPVERRSC